MIRKYLRSNSVIRRFKSFSEYVFNSRHSKFRVLKRIFWRSDNYTLLDVGANVGQFAIDALNAGFKGEIHSFEPVSEYFTLLENKARNYEKWSVWKFGLGNLEKYSEIHVSGNDGLSSSVLTMKKDHLDFFPNSNTLRKEIIQIRTLDKFILENIELNKQIFLKIDVQGFEMKVLEGLGESINKIQYIYLEASISPLYEGESEFDQLLAFVRIKNFRLFQMFTGLRDGQGNLLQVDLLFINSLLS